MNATLWMIKDAATIAITSNWDILLFCQLLNQNAQQVVLRQVAFEMQ
jgi:hypothetical protein